MTPQRWMCHDKPGDEDDRDALVVEVVEASAFDAVVRERDELAESLFECYKQTGADPSDGIIVIGSSGHCAVEEVTRLRAEQEALIMEVLATEARVRELESRELDDFTYTDEGGGGGVLSVYFGRREWALSRRWGFERFRGGARVWGVAVAVRELRAGDARWPLVPVEHVAMPVVREALWYAKQVTCDCLSHHQALEVAYDLLIGLEQEAVDAR